MCGIFRVFYIYEQRQFYFFLPNLDVFYFFFLPNYLPVTPSTILYRKGENKYPCLIPDFREKAFSILLLSVMFTMSTLW